MVFLKDYFEKRRLSSNITAVFQIVMPVLALYLFLPLVIRGFKSLSSESICFALVIVMGIVGYILLVKRLRIVSVDERVLYVSNYFKEIEIPLSEIRFVYDSWISSPRIITVELHNESQFGRKIRFIGRSWIGFSEHPVVKEIRDKAELNA